MPIATVVIPLLNSLVKILIGVGQVFASFMARLFGVGDSWKDIIGDFGNVGGGADFSGMEDALENSESSAGGVADGLDSASKKAKEVKKQLMGIDEINNLDLPDDSSSSGGASGGGGGGAGYTPNLEWDLPTTPDPDAYPDELTKKIEQALKDIFKPLKDSYDKYMPSIFANLTDGFNNIAHVGKEAFNIIRENWGIWAGAVTDLFFSSLNTVTTVFDGITIIFRSAWDNGGNYLFEQMHNLSAIITRFATVINDYIVQPFLEAFNTYLAPIIGEFIGKVLFELADKIQDISIKIETITDDIKAMGEIGTFDFSNINTFQTALAGIATILVAGGLIANFKNLVGVVTNLMTLGPAVSNFVSSLGGIGGILTQLTTPFTVFFDGVANGNGIVTSLQAVLPGMGTSISGLINPFTIVSVAVVGLVAGFVYLYTTCEDFRNKMNEIFSSIVENVSGIVSGLVEIVKTIWDEGVSPVIDSLVAGFQYLWDNGLSALIENVSMFIGNVINMVLSIWNNAINPLINLLLNTFLPIFTTIFDGILAIALPIISKIMEYVNMFIEVLNVVMDVLNDSVFPIFKTVFDGISEAIEDFFDFAKPIFDDFIKIAGNIVKFLTDTFMLAFDVVFSTIVSIVKAIAEPIKSVINGVKQVFQGIIDFVLGVFTGDWKRAWEGVKSIFSGIFESLKGVVSGVWNGILALFANGGKIFSGVVEGIKNVFKNIVNSLVDGINKVIAVPFKGINGLLNEIRSFSILGQKPFLGLWGKNPLSIPKIPKLASGGIAYGDTLVEVAEYTNAKSNPEVISPLNELRGLMKETIKEVVEETNQQNNSSSSQNDDNRLVHASFYLDKKVVYEATVEEDKKVRRSTGKSGFAY